MVTEYKWVVRQYIDVDQQGQIVDSYVELEYYDTEVEAKAAYDALTIDLGDAVVKYSDDTYGILADISISPEPEPLDYPF